ncbi:MAG: tripartite tricarboxylate transporter substrate binding protein [Betaproteobacteria bacterium]|nr:tripartite tricarboxylate transporter substrate binding protein [Betaproteobacteria bacterium]
MKPLHALCYGLVAALGATVPLAAQPQAYPSKPIRVIVPAVAGSAPDVRMRQVAPRMAEALAQPMVVENRPGANGAIGAREAARGAPDGYTLLHANISNALNDIFSIEKGARLTEEFAAIGDIEAGPMIMVVHPSVPAKTLKEFIELARAKPHTLTYASGGPGGLIQLLGERVKLAAGGIEVTEVPYKSPGADLPDLLAGHVMVGYGVWPTLGAHIRSGRLRALAVASAARRPMAPEIPTMAEAGLPGLETTAWNGLFALAGTPQAVIQTLHQALLRALASPEVREQFATTGSMSGGKTPEQFTEFVRAEKARWAQVVKEAGIKLQ